MNLNEILNSDDIKVSVKEALDIIDKEVEEIRGAVSYLNNLKLSSEEIAKIIVVLKVLYLMQNSIKRPLNIC